MTVRIRLARFGTTHKPYYRITVANSFNKRDGKFIERIGSYDPRPDSNGAKLIQIDFERARYWLGVGAQPSEPVMRLFGKAGLLPSIPRGPVTTPSITSATINPTTEEQRLPE